MGCMGASGRRRRRLAGARGRPARGGPLARRRTLVRGAPGAVKPPPGPTRESFWRSPLRGPWLTTTLGSLLLPLVLVVGATGFFSNAAYQPGLGRNAVLPPGGV